MPESSEGTSYNTTDGSETSDGKIDMGINIPKQSYSTEILMYNDLQKTASALISDDSGYDWDTGMIDEIPLDSNGYPLELPVTTSNGESTWVKYLINNQIADDYIIYYEGTGTFANAASLEDDGYYHIHTDGDGGNTVVEIRSSDVNDPITNIRIVPATYGPTDEVPTFRDDFMSLLDDFKVLRTMDYTQTNGSILTDTRVQETYFTQSTSEKGACYEHVIEMANTSGKDVWVCVPHMASDAYITEMATLFRDNLDSNLKIYLEYSNELWNWIFRQANWVLYNGNYGDYTAPVDAYVATDLEAIGEAGDYHPEKDAYMMARTFRLWADVFGSEMSTRVIREATVQAVYESTSNRILTYLFDTDGIGADALSPTAYFGFGSDIHDEWITAVGEGTLDYTTIYNDMVLEVEDNTYELHNKALADARGIPVHCYEGGQHMQPYNQSEWDYNQTLWDFQIQPEMYELYKKNFEKITSTDVDYKLFCAFDLMRTRESKYGSWGHLESMDQIGGDNGDYTNIAPKYQALLDYAKA